MAISLEQAVLALISNGYFFDESYSGPGIRLHNDADLSFDLHNGKLIISQYIEQHGKGFISPVYGSIICEYALDNCYINGQGELSLGEPISKRLECYD